MAWQLFRRLSHHNLALDLIRIFLGVALFVRGCLFITDQEALMNLVLQNNLDWFWPAVLVHYVTLAHIVGGLMLAFGLLSRVAALVQIPILIGAVFFVHLQEGLGTPEQSLELAALVLFLLVVVFFFGSGKLSMDYHFFARKPGSLDSEAPLVTVINEEQDPPPTRTREERPPIRTPRDRDRVV